jgi:cell division protein FtsB
MPAARPATSAVRGSRAQRAQSAQAARAAQRPARPHPPRSVTLRLPSSRVRWDRKFRIAMLVVLGFVGYLGIKGMVTLLNTRLQAEAQQAIVHRLAAENRRLEREQQALGQPSTIAAAARGLGMVRSGERAYAVTGLPGR